MSVSMNNLFNFGRSLPEPFNTVTNKKITKVHSVYGASTEATLCSTVIKAVNAVCRLMDGSGSGAVGTIDHRTVAEYKSSSGKDIFNIVVYDSNSGALMASVFDVNTETVENYTLGNNKKDGTAIIMAMFPKLIEDEEFQDNFEEYYSDYLGGFPDMNSATEHMAMLCDNVYRRIKDETCTAHLKVILDDSGNVLRVSQTQLDSGAFTPTAVTAGEFNIFAKIARTEPVKATPILIEHKDFLGKYTLHSRGFSEVEKNMIPSLPSWYVIPKEVVDICKHASLTTGKPTQMRNFMLRGPAGTGKTMGAKAIAAGLGLPYMKYTCSAGSEIYDFIGQVLPVFDETSTGDAKLDEERKELKSMGGINYANVAKLMKLPELDDMDYDPTGVYESLTGVVKADATTQECMSIVLNRVADKIKELSKTVETPSKGQTYIYEETDFIKALKNGYLVEIQEPTVIVQPGVLVGLNSLLEQEGTITLPTGEIIERHPDSVVVVTTNVDYEGCRGLNQSTVDRMSLVMDVELPTPEIMTQRAMAVTGATDEYRISQMVGVVNDMADFCRKNSISDGNVGMRSLLDWIISTEITGDPYSAALSTIISKATSDETDRATLISSVLEPIFSPPKYKKAV